MGAGGPTSFSVHTQATLSRESAYSVSQTEQVPVMNDLGRMVTEIIAFLPVPLKVSIHK